MRRAADRVTAEHGHKLRKVRQALIAGWDHRLLGAQLRELSELSLDFSPEVTGFDMPEIDLLIEGAVFPRRATEKKSHSTFGAASACINPTQPPAVTVASVEVASHVPGSALPCNHARRDTVVPLTRRRSHVNAVGAVGE